VLQAWTTISTSISVKEVEPNVGELLDRLEFLLEEKENLGLSVDVGGQPLERDPTSSLVDESSIFGMDDDKDAIVNSLLLDGASGGGMRVIAIVGMGGIGKTTLAQLVYNDDRLNNKHFDLKAWVCVSDDQFSLLKLTKKILEGVDLRADSDNLNQLQSKLMEKLKGKKILLVLDDVWNIKRREWERLSIPFKSGGAQEIRVLITTRDEKVASNMFASETHRINELREKDCWLLFEKYAFQNLNPHARQEREELGRQILKKCKSLPLAIKAIGSLLGSESNVKVWSDVLESELWHLPIEETDILPALSLSYKHFPPHLRRCFAYCTIFPKDYVFKKDDLVLLWMAEGLLPKRQNRTLEEVGDEYFFTLVSRSLFQRFSDDHQYIMHDLVSDLTKFISEPFTLRHEDGYFRESESKTRHFSCFYNKFHIEGFEVLQIADKLRTLINLESAVKITQFSLSKLRCLRVLIILCSPWDDSIELPDSIEELILLRCLGFSSHYIETLPETICQLCNLQILDLSDCDCLVALPTDMHKLINLQILNLSYCDNLVALPRDMHKLINLQILNLSYCRSLVVLPRDMHKLINLRDLNIEESGIMEMPINLGELKCLQTLSTFIVTNSGCGIEGLGKLTNLRGSLSVLVLQNVESPTAVEGNNLRDMKYLENLVLKWKGDTNASKSHKIVLDSFRPHTNLKILTIKDYEGTSFPDWVGDASFSNIASLCLDNCKFCCNLPPLGQLPFLQNLSIIGLDGVVTIDRQFYGSGSHSMKPFGALKSLRFSHMLEWKEWSPFEVENEGRAFPNLRDLSISECHKLTSGLPAHLPSLAELFIENCPQLVASIPRASFLRKLTFSICNTVLLNERFYYSSLEKLTLYTCGFLKSFPIPLFPKLHCLKISNCEDLESLTVGEQHEQDLLLSQIEINQCPNFAYFPLGGLRAPNLKEFSIHDCRSLQSLPEKMHILLPSLDKLSISDCPEVESFPEGGLPSNLNVISIFHCDKLFASRLGWGLQTLPCVRRFSISDKSEDAKSFPDEGLLPNNLTYLDIKLFPNLKYLNLKGLQHLTALEELEIRCCPELECMLEDGLPASLSTIRMYGCPLLEKELERKEGEEWVKIAHVPYKDIGLMR
jgi:hypothetical protein